MDFLVENIWNIWQAGGWLMLPLTALGLLIYFTLFEILLYLCRHDFIHRNPDEWGHWVDRPEEAQGKLGELLQYAQHEVETPAEVRTRMDEIRSVHLARLDRRLRFATILVGTAPLTGLLGTVTGMLSTFAGLSVASGGNTIDLVAGGISEALITTQAGLVMAIPGYVLIHMAKRRRDSLEAFFHQVEILTLQKQERARARALRPSA